MMFQAEIDNDYLRAVIPVVSSLLVLPTGKGPDFSRKERLVDLRIERGYDAKGELAAWDDCVAYIEVVTDYTPDHRRGEPAPPWADWIKTDTWSFPFARVEHLSVDPAQIALKIQRQLDGRQKWAELLVGRMMNGEDPLTGRSL